MLRVRRPKQQVNRNLMRGLTALEKRFQQATLIAGNSDKFLTEVVNLAQCFVLVIDSDGTMLTPHQTKVQYLNHYGRYINI